MDTHSVALCKSSLRVIYKGDSRYLIRLLINLNMVRLRTLFCFSYYLVCHDRHSESVKFVIWTTKRLTAILCFFMAHLSIIRELREVINNY